MMRVKAAWMGVLVLIVIFLPSVSADPEVLPTSAPENDVMAGGADFVRFASNCDAGAGGCNLEMVVQVVAPSGETVVIQGASPTGNGCNVAATYYFNGTFRNSFGWDPVGQFGTPCWVATPPQLVGAAVNGTWSFEMTGQSWNGSSSSATRPGVQMSIQGKNAYFGFSRSDLVSGAGVPQLWNWHITETVWEEPSTSPDLPGLGEMDPPDEAPDEDPNEARFFVDLAEPPPTDDTQGLGAPIPVSATSTVDCPNMADLEGTWVRGLVQTENTFARFAYADGITPVLSNPQFTAWADVGGGSFGTHVETVLYNNAVGLSFSLQVRNGTGGTPQEGTVFFAAPMQCDIEPPDIDQIRLRLDDFHFTVSQAQCMGDATSFSIIEDLPSTILFGDPVLTVYPATSTTPVLQVPIGGWTTPADGIWQTEALLPPGAYNAIGTSANLLGLVSLLDAHAFNVPEGACTDSFFPTDLTPVLAAIDAKTTLVLNEIASLNATNQASFLDLCMKILTAEGNLTELIGMINQTFNIGNLTTFQNATLALEPSDFQAASGFTGGEFFALLFLAAVGLIVCVLGKDRVVGIVGGLLVMMVGLFLLVFGEHELVFLLGIMFLLLAPVCMLKAWLPIYLERRGPRKFFQR